MLLKYIACACLFLTTSKGFSQKKPGYQFQPVVLSDLSKEAYEIDTNANAIILADVGSTKFTGNNKGWFTMIFKRHTRLRILKNSAMELATFRISLYKKKDDEEKLLDLKAFTYNKKNGALIETELDKKDIFSEKLNKNWVEKKFTMPAVTEGSIIDISYTIESDFIFNLHPWTFQHTSYPCLWSDYQVSVPELLNYVFLKQGFNKYHIEKRDRNSEVYSILREVDDVNLGAQPQRFSVTTSNNLYRWVMKDLPRLNNVDYVNTPVNYVDKVEFQLSQVYDGQDYKDVMDTWPKVSEDLLKREDFGEPLTQNNYWLDDDVKQAVVNSSSTLDITRDIYLFVKKNYTSTGDGIFIKSKFVDVFRNRRGNAGEINLLLIAMLRKRGVKADPVIVSTKSHGKPYDQYPLVSKYNYAFCRVLINGNTYYLDASNPLLGFGKLDPECYNGYGRVISNVSQSVNLSPDSLKESKAILANVTANPQGGLLVNIQKMPGYYESYKIRRQIAKTNTGSYFGDLQKLLPEGASDAHFELDSLNNHNEKLGIRYNFSLPPEAAKMLYINPFFGNEYVKNFFKADDRILPVEMDSPANTTYVLNFQIPQGYEVEELPKSIKLKLNNEGDGIFEYLIQKDESKISLRAGLIIKRTYFSPDEYKMLREFFNVIIKKQGENIILKKIN